MPEPVEEPLADADHLVAPPLIDMLYRDPERRAYSVTFIPDSSVSRREKELVLVDEISEDGRRIALRLRQLSTLFRKPVARIFHRGGGDFGFYSADGDLFELSSEEPDNDLSQRAYVELQDLGMIAQIAFREAQLAHLTAP